MSNIELEAKYAFLDETGLVGLIINDTPNIASDISKIFSRCF